MTEVTYIHGQRTFMKPITLLSFLAISLFIFISCQKEYSIENGQSFSSTGSLKTVSGACMPSNVNGLFRKGIAVNDSNYIDVTINVIATGLYVVVSDTVNGIHFMGAGVFNTAGTNTVRLAAKGIPILGGTFQFTITYNNSSCNITVPVTDATTAAAIFTFAAGTGGTCMGAVLNGIYTAGIALNTSNSVNLTVNATTPGTWSVSTAATNGIIFSGSGTFAGTGNQVIVLAASGTPVAAGNFNISAVKGASTCTFSVMVQPSGTGAAVFSLGGAGSTCTGATLSGAYKAGVAMTSSNTSKITVTVTTLGTYSISTTAMNGVTFSGAGSFTTTGSQQVTLTATGTPAAAGTYNFSVPAGSATCTFPVTFTAAAGPAVFTLSGAPLACLTPVTNGSYVATIPMNAANTVVIKVNVTTAGAYTITTNTVNGISFSHSGVFASTGTGIDVTLTATGTPAAAGTSTFSPQAGTSACTFDVVTTAPSGIYNCKIDGVFTSFYDRAVASTDDSGTPYLYLDGFIAPPNGGNIPELQIFINNNDNSPVTTGTYNVDGILLPNGYRIEIDYKVVNPDFSVTIWNTSSSLLTTNPPFTITITSITLTRVKGTFSGKVTNVLQGSTMQKTLTEGVFDLPIQ